MRLFILLCLFIFLQSSCKPLYEKYEDNDKKKLSLTKPDLSSDKILYVVAYSHLDTQWLWTYKTTINEYIRQTLDGNFNLFEKYPDYNFNFTGSIRYEMFQEYYPERFEKLKEYIKKDRWFVSGSSVDEGDVNVPSSESIFRQILLSNNYYRKEFGKESEDYMLPDCFGFPASMPSIWAHAGLKGFSTQKLSWGSAVGIPFNVGVWEGPDGRSIIAALNPGEYVGRVKKPLNTNSSWVERVNDNGQKYGVYADYHYYGVGDRGGAPRESDVRNVLASIGETGPIKIISGSSDLMFKHITPEQKNNLPRFKGDMLLTEHSSGTLTSKAFMKRWNLKNELLADAGEKAASIANWLGSKIYPKEKLNRAWNRLLGSQMHDILPGTSIPKAYEYSYNDEIVALNGFSQVLENSVGASIRALNTEGLGRSLVIYNPLSIERSDLVTVNLDYHDGVPSHLQLFDRDKNIIPIQVLSKSSTKLSFIFKANVPSLGFHVYDLREVDNTVLAKNNLKINSRRMENEYFIVTFNDRGNVSSIIDKSFGNKELLKAPLSLDFQYEKPQEFPAWNMDWADRQKPPYAQVDSLKSIKIVENGPLRVSLELRKEAQNSVFVEKISLSTGSKHIEFSTGIDWLSRNSSLKAAFPLTVSSSMATYNWGLGTIERGNNEPKKYEVPSHQWFDLTDEDGSYGVSILSVAKYGSDKPDNNTLRLTLLFSPNTESGGYDYEATQDWGHHDIRYAMYPHRGSWKEAESQWHGARLNQGLISFESIDKHPGSLGKYFSFASLNTSRVAVKAMKKAELGEQTIIRLQELKGEATGRVVVDFASEIISLEEVDGQERRIKGESNARIENGNLVLSMSKYSPRTFAVTLAKPNLEILPPKSTPLTLAFNVDVISGDFKANEGAMVQSGESYPKEQFPHELVSNGIKFDLGHTKGLEKNAMTALGQTIYFPQGEHRYLHFLAASDEDVLENFSFNDRVLPLKIQKWHGSIGDFDNRIWDENDDEVISIRPGFIKRNSIAWFATHRHLSNGENDAYNFTYLFHYKIKLADSEQYMTLPDNKKIKIFAMSLASDFNSDVTPLMSLYDDFSDRKVLQP